MSVEMRDDDELVDPSVHCSHCAAVCCRLRVIVGPADQVPRNLTTADAEGLVMMARAQEGWCVALDRPSKRCTIYATRPGACQRFTMGAGFCRAVRMDFDAHFPGIIPHVLTDSS